MMILANAIAIVSSALMLLQAPATPPADTSQGTPAADTQPLREIKPGPLQLLADPPALDMGFLLPNTNGRGVINFKNIGSEPLRITSATATCKCTTLSTLAGTLLAPDQSVALEVELAGAPALGARTSSIKVIVEGYARILEVPVRAEVAMMVRTVPPYINAVAGKNLRGRLVVESTDRLPFRVCSVDGKAPKFLGFDPASEEPKSSYLLAYDLSEYEAGNTPRFWVITTDHPSAPVVDVRVRHDETSFMPVFKMKDFRMNLGAIDQGTSAEITLEANDLGGPFQAATSASRDAAVELLSSTVEGNVSKAVVRITPRADASGFLYFPLILGASRGTQEIDCFGVVRPAGSTECVTQNMVRTPSSDSSVDAPPSRLGDPAAGRPSVRPPVPGRTKTSDAKPAPGG